MLGVEQGLNLGLNKKVSVFNGYKYILYEFNPLNPNLSVLVLREKYLDILSESG